MEILIVGISPECTNTAQLMKLGRQSDIFLCSSENLELLRSELEDEMLAKFIPIYPLAHCYQEIEKLADHQTALVLTSGDPLFYGFGKTLRNRYPEARFSFFPSLSSMQLCFSRFGIPWEKASFVSLHGRELQQLENHLQKNPLFILTDKKNTPDVIARHIRTLVGQRSSHRFMMMVGERLGMEGERLTTGSLEEIASADFQHPNCIILSIQPGKKEKKYSLGLDETEIMHSRGLITKNEVRASVIHALRLPEKGIFWDIGAGSGSISIESGRLNRKLNVYAIERNEQQIANIEHNRQAYNCWNVHVVKGQAPDVLVGLPEPDVVFIGGSGGNLEKIINYVSNIRTKPERIVVTGVTDSTCSKAPRILSHKGYNVSVSVLSVTRFQYPENVPQSLNSIHIIKGTSEKI